MTKVQMLAVLNALANNKRADLLKSLSVLIPASVYRRAFPLSRRLLDAEIATVSRIMSFTDILIAKVPGVDKEDE